MDTLYKDIILSHHTIAGNLFLAPLAGYSDAAFRNVCIEEGASLAFTEMISAEALHRGSTKTLDLILRAKNEKEYGIQLFTSNIEAAVSCAKIIEKYSPLIIDLNCGCSVPKILRSDSGAALMKKPQFIGEIVKALANTVSVPISVKLRLGWDMDNITCFEAAESAVKNGASMVSLHPRTRSQGFGGKADWSYLTKLKKLINVPVIGSGDLFSPEDAQRMLVETKIDGVMFARGAIGNPFIFSLTKNRLLHKDLSSEITAEKRLFTALRHLNLMLEYKPELIACREIRKHFSHYVKGLPGAGSIRQKINGYETVLEYETLINEYLNENDL